MKLELIAHNKVSVAIFKALIEQRKERNKFAC